MGINTDRWSRATEELQIYDNQLQNLTETKIFKDILSNQALKLTNPKTQLFFKFENSSQAKGSSRRVSNRTTKK
jgi:hypothetical protein